MDLPLPPGCGCLFSVAVIGFAFVVTIALLCVLPSMVGTMLP